jgi:hypothetical protein
MQAAIPPHGEAIPNSLLHAAVKERRGTAETYELKKGKEEKKVESDPYYKAMYHHRYLAKCVLPSKLRALPLCFLSL